MRRANTRVALAAVFVLIAAFPARGGSPQPPGKAPVPITMPARGICAHRGASRSHPENTLVAFREAIRLGAHQIELDVRLSSDGQLVLMHDATVDRTTDGHGRVADLTLAEIKRLDAGSWKGPEFAGERVPTLAEALQVMPQNVWLNLHLKGGADLGAAVAREVVRQKRAHQAFLACSRAAAGAARKVHPDIFICNMERQGTSTRYVNETIAARCRFIQLAGWPALPDDMRRLREAGIRINYFGTNNPKMLKPLYDAGVEFPLVDDVAIMMGAARKLGVKPLVPVYSKAAGAAESD